jgi:16S rRNA processing protein RimM
VNSYFVVPDSYRDRRSIVRMTKQECYNLGYIARKVGNHGELGFVLDVDDPQRYRNLESVFVELRGSLVPFFIKKIFIKGNNATVSLDGVDSIAQAEELVKAGLFLPLTMLPPKKGKEFYFHEMAGYTAVDVNLGELGNVTGVLDFPQQAIFQIQRGAQEILVPAKEHFIVSIDREKKVLLLHTPEGLVDIYLGKNEAPDEEKELE